MQMKKRPDMSFIIQGFCGKNMSNVDMRGLSQEYFKRLTFDGNTQFPKNPDLMPKFIREQNEFKNLSEYANKLMEQGKSFVNIEQLHKEGINGEGTTIALIDSCFDSSAKEFEGRVAKHIIFKENKDTGKIELVIEHDEDNPDIKYSHEDYGDDFHGKTTASLAAGKECGVAPNAKLYLFGIAENNSYSYEGVLACDKVIGYIELSNTSTKSTLFEKIQISFLIPWSTNFEMTNFFILELTPNANPIVKKGISSIHPITNFENFNDDLKITEDEIKEIKKNNNWILNNKNYNHFYYDK